MSPGHGGGQYDAGRAYLENLGSEGYEELRRKVIASLGCFSQLNPDERADVTTEAVFMVLRSGRLDPSKQPVAYIKTTARRLALEKLKRAGGTVLMDNVDLSGLADVQVEAEPDEQDEELEARVSQGMSRIASPQQREVTSRMARGESAKKVAESLGISRQQVDTQYNRGRAKVRAAPEVSPFVRAAYVQSAGRRRLAKDGE
ncbi:sigma-70 family RNA polymerase sigma factor [Streptomyces glycanivorans]|uniref:Sigma-70 family RNA polymerase sigma factor n=1 Tax=Streptomyces glycanivorans TaxID=3033808 RepID=A0ABY9JRC8_9ACTN|nr:sigma-70 family RNA polymerase sigma factor [Streptomyces sp. Alt3]WLQ69324.1 sigma-70 family RNA polymerase sigma factor [Streptomyces sp. Alt3]